MPARFTFSFKSVRFKAPRHLPDCTIQIRFERRRPTQRVVVYYKAERMGQARPLDPVREITRGRWFSDQTFDQVSTSFAFAEG